MIQDFVFRLLRNTMFSNHYYYYVVSDKVDLSRCYIK